MEPTNVSYYSHMIKRIKVREQTPYRLIRPRISEAIPKYNFNNKSGLLQYWECRESSNSEDNGRNLMLMGEPFVSTDEDHEGLIRYRTKYLNNANRFVGIETDVGSWFAGRAAQTRIADHRTKHLVLTPDYQHSAEAQGMGQLVMPVFSDGQGAEPMELEGIIELVTTQPKECYFEDFEQLQNLLKDVGLTSKFMGKTIKVEYKPGLTVKFPLPYSAKFADLHKEVTKRFKDLEHTNFRFEYNDTNNNRLPITGNEELRVCMAESSSQGARFVKMYINKY